MINVVGNGQLSFVCRITNRLLRFVGIWVDSYYSSDNFFVWYYYLLVLYYYFGLF